MNDVEFHKRVLLDNKDWATILFFLSVCVLAMVKTSFENRFNDFTKLILSNKYVKMYKDSSQIMSLFTVLTFIVHLISFTFFVQMFLNSLGYASKYNGITFIQILTGLTVFILAKYLIEKIVAIIFNMEEFIDYFNLIKVNYRTYMAIILLPINLILFFNNNLKKEVFYIIFIIIFIFNIIIYLNSLKKQQNILIRKFIYFILYLCTLEIAPYYFIGYLFYKKMGQ